MGLKVIVVKFISRVRKKVQVKNGPSRWAIGYKKVQIVKKISKNNQKKKIIQIVKGKKTTKK